MKIFYGFFLGLITLMSFAFPLHAQNCEGVSVEVVPMHPQTGQYNYFGVRVTLSQAYTEAVTVVGIISEEGGGGPNSEFTLTISQGELSAETSTTFFQTGPTSGANVSISSVTPCPPSGGSDVSVNGNRLKFPSIALYEQYADNQLDRSTLTNLATSSSEITTLQEINNEQDTLYPDFLKQVLNQDLILEAGSFLIKIDLENERALVTNSGESNAYQSLVSNQLTAQGMMNFDLDVSNGIEILEAIENGTLQTSNYQSAIERSTSRIKVFNTPSESLTGIEPPQIKGVGSGGPSANYFDNKQIVAQIHMICPHADRRENKRTQGWDTGTGESGCPDNIIVYVRDAKVVYQKAVFYFSLQSKIKSNWSGTCSNWIFIPSYDALLKLEGTTRFVKRCGNEQTPSITDYNNGRELNWRPYEGSRSLSKYDITVTFGIKHQGSSGDYNSTGPMRIVAGY